MDKHLGYNNNLYAYSDPANYKQLEHYLSKGRNKDDRPIANNTRVIRRSPTTIAIKLHNTDVLTFFENDSIQLNTDGWKTVTTKDRINRFLPDGMYVYSERSVWYFRLGNWNEGTRYLYEDYMIITHDRHITDANGKAIKEHSPAQEKKKRNQLRKVDNYIKKFMAKLESGKLPAPGAGDCWYCQAFNGQPIAEKMHKGEVINGQIELKPMTDKANIPTDHIQSHIKENYFVPTLLWNAIKSEFYDPNGVFGNPNMTYGLAEVDKHNISCWFNPDTEHRPFASDMTIRRLKKAMKQFIIKQLNI